MISRKTASLTLRRATTSASVPKRMIDMSGAVASLIVREHGPLELLHRLSDPFWFQAFGCVLGLDWHANSVTPAVCSALKEAARKHGRDLGIVVCGGKGATGKKAPDEIRRACDRTGDQAEPLIYASKLASKVDSICVQDGFEIYHHTFIFVPGCGAWTLVQQGLNAGRKIARRYHWNSMRLPSFVSEPHTAVACERRVNVLNLVAGEGVKHRQAITALTREHPDRVMRELQTYLKGPPGSSFESNGHSRNGRNGKKSATIAGPSPRRRARELNPTAIKKVLLKTFESQACDFEELLGRSSIGADSLRTLSLLAEAIYQAPASRRDPAVYSFAQGGKDGQPFAGEKARYDRHLERLRLAVESAKIGDTDKVKALKALADFTSRLSK